MARWPAPLAPMLSVLVFAVAAPHAALADCDNPNALGVSRTVEIDTTGGPGFGMDHYKAYDFLQDKEVVLTFDDGPQKFSTEAVLKALAHHCTKATFFSVGKMALGYPSIIREVSAAGHTVGTHTWSHKTIPKLKTFDAGKDEIERGISAVKRAMGGPIAPFFRYPTLRDSKETIKHLQVRNISMFSTDIDSFDFKLQKPHVLAKSIIAKLEKRGKGIVLMHDIHRNTAKALPIFLDLLHEKGFKIVHLTAAGEVATLPEFDKAIEPDVKGLPQVGKSKPVFSFIKTVKGKPTPEEEAAAAKAANPANAVSPEAASSPAAPQGQPATAPRGDAGDKTDAKPDQPSKRSETVAPPVSRIGMVAAPTSPVRTAPANRPAAVNGQDAGMPGQDAGAAPAGPGASLSATAEEMWRMWFGK